MAQAFLEAMGLDVLSLGMGANYSSLFCMSEVTSLFARKVVGVAGDAVDAEDILRKAAQVLRVEATDSDVG